MNKKLKSLLALALLIILLSLSGVVNAATIKMTAETSSYLKAGETVEVIFKLSQADVGISAFSGTLEYDTDVFEEVTEDNFEGLNRWNSPVYESTTGIFSTTKSSAVNTASDLFRLTLRVKETNTASTTTIKFKSVTASDGAETGDIEVEVDNDLVIEEENSEPSTNTTVNETTNEVINITNVVNTIANTVTSNVTNSNSSTGRLPQTGDSFGIAAGITIVAIVAVVAFIKYRNLNI